MNTNDWTPLCIECGYPLEDGDCPVCAEEDEGFNAQELIDSGMAWRLEGAVGRACMDAINAGACTLGETGHRDYWGNYVPSKYEVQPGTKGSVEYCEARNWGEEG